MASSKTKAKGTITGKHRQWLKGWRAAFSPMAEKADPSPLLESREVGMWVQATCTHTYKKLPCKSKH